MTESTPKGLFAGAPKLEFDQLVDQLIEQARDVKIAQRRLQALLRAIEVVAGDLSLEAVLSNVVEAACELAHAQYGALGVIGADGTLEKFVHSGVSESVARRIGHPPRGEGLLGLLIDDPRPIRLRTLNDDPRSVGLPAHHPPMESFLGVPVHVRDQVYGNLYLANSSAGEFSSDDENLVMALAVAAGTAISNARLYQESRLQQRWLEASVEIGTQLFAQVGEDPLALIARRAIDVSDADLVILSLITDDRQGLVVEYAFGADGAVLVGQRFEISQTFAGSSVHQNTPLLMRNIVEDAATEVSDPMLAGRELGPLMCLPLAGADAPRGALTLARRRQRPPFSPTELTMASGFANHASVALEVADSRAAERKLILLEDRDRIARDLHDHVIQELFAIGLSLEGVASTSGLDPAISSRIHQRVEDLGRTIRRVRTSIFAIRSSEGGPNGEGLRTAILSIAGDLTPALGFSPHVVFSGLVELAADPALIEDVTACVREALTNVAKHAEANSATIDLAMGDHELTVTVSDDGVGVGSDAGGRRSGTANLAARAERRGGEFELLDGLSGGTVARWKVPMR